MTRLAERYVLGKIIWNSESVARCYETELRMLHYKHVLRPINVITLSEFYTCRSEGASLKEDTLLSSLHPSILMTTLIIFA